jgi:hypothetical protein
MNSISGDVAAERVDGNCKCLDELKYSNNEMPSTYSKLSINITFVESYPVDDVDESEGVIDNPDTPSEIPFDPV